MLELRKLTVKMINLSGWVMTVASGLSLFSFMIAIVLIKAAHIHWEILEDVSHDMDHAASIIFAAMVSVAIGIILIVGAKKIQQNDKAMLWSVVSLTLGLVALFAVGKGHDMIQSAAGIVAAVGGGLSLHAVLKEQPE